MTRRKLITLLFGIPLLAIGAILLYVRFADLSGWRDTVAEKLSARLGRAVRIAGEFKPEIGFTTRLTAGEITLANPGWSDDATMATVHRMVLDVNLWSLVSGPLMIHNVEIDGARVLLEKDAHGRVNWDFDTGADSAPSSGPLEVVLKHILVEDLQLTLHEPSRAAPLRAEITRFESTEDEEGMLDLELNGVFDEQKFQVSGRLGTLIGLLNATALDYDLSGELDSVRFTSKGEVSELKTLHGADITADFNGGDLTDLHNLVELPSELTGPFSLSVALSPAPSGSGVELDAAAAGITAKVTGTVDCLLEPKVVDATVTASGSSIRTVGSLTGVADLPDEAFSVSGGVRWKGFPITVRQVELTVGGNSLAADGVLGAPPAMLGTDFTMHGEGPDISSIGALAGIDLPRDSFSIDGRLLRIEGGLEFEKLEARVGRAQLSAHGRVGDPPDYVGTTLSVHAEGPNIARFNHLIGMKLPAVDFAINGRFAQGREAITLDGVNARVGTTTVRADGSLRTDAGLTGTTLKIEAQGSDATQIMLLAGFTDLPDEPWTAFGGLAFLKSGYRLNEVSADFGSLHVKADGLVAAAPRSVGTNLRLHVEDSDLSHAMAVFNVEGFPQQPVRANGLLRIEDDGYGLEGVTATAGDIEVAVDGLIGRGSIVEGTNAHLEVHGPRLSSVGPYFHFPGLPQAPFSVVGDVRVSGGRIELENLVTEVDSNRVILDGAIAPVRGLVGSDVRINARGPDLSRAGRLAEGLTEVPELPAKAFTLVTGFSIDDAGYGIDGLRATLDRAAASVDGRVGTQAKMVGTDLSITADGPNASLFSALTGVAIPVAPFKVRGRVQRTDTAFLFDHATVELGGHTVTLHGSLGEAPRLVGTDLDLYASGDGTTLIAELTGYEKLPNQPFKISGHFNGTPQKFTADGLNIVLGESDVKGSLDVDIRGKPDVTAQLVSDQLHLEGLLHPVAENGDVEPEPAASKTTRLISDEPIDFGWLERADADVDITIGILQTPLERFHDVEVSARLVDGRLDVHHLAMAGSRGGNGSGSLVLEPANDGYLADLVLTVEAVRFALPGKIAPNAASEPPFDVDVRLRAQGTSPHGFAASADGSIEIVFGKGLMDNRALDLISQDFLLTLLTAFNPFAKHETATELQCAIALLTFEDGLMTLDPMAMQSNRMTMLGEGTVNFKTEKLNLDWITKPRKGVGLSASMITNPYIKLGGTLSKPAIELKGMQAVASTGVAVATLGISLVAKGMLDRATAEKKVCKIALEQIADRTSGSKKKSGE